MTIIQIIGMVLGLITMGLKHILTRNSEKKKVQKQAKEEAVEALENNDYDAYLNARAKFYNA